MLSVDGFPLAAIWFTTKEAVTATSSTFLFICWVSTTASNFCWIHWHSKQPLHTTGTVRHHEEKQTRKTKLTRKELRWYPVERSEAVPALHTSRQDGCMDCCCHTWSETLGFNMETYNHSEEPPNIQMDHFNLLLNIKNILSACHISTCLPSTRLSHQ